MEHVTPRLLAAWLVGALALSLAVVGCGTITSKDRPVDSLAKYKDIKILNGGGTRLKPCTMSNGNVGLKFDDLCLPAPPAGWTGLPNVRLPGQIKPGSRLVIPSDVMIKSVQPASFLTLPDTRDCRTSIFPTEPLAA
jgi:hypothetical protein